MINQSSNYYLVDLSLFYIQKNFIGKNGKNKRNWHFIVDLFFITRDFFASGLTEFLTVETHFLPITIVEGVNMRKEDSLGLKNNCSHLNNKKLR